MRKFPVKRLILSQSMLANVVASDGTPVSGAGPWLDPTGGHTASTPVTGNGPGLNPNGGGPV